MQRYQASTIPSRYPVARDFSLNPADGDVTLGSDGNPIYTWRPLADADTGVFKASVICERVKRKAIEQVFANVGARQLGEEVDCSAAVNSSYLAPSHLELLR